MARFNVSEYCKAAMERAVFEELEDGTYAGEIPECPGVLAFTATREECEVELRSVLEEWVELGLRLGHEIPKVQNR